jgi:hypothetical protein
VTGNQAHGLADVALDGLGLGVHALQDGRGLGALVLHQKQRGRSQGSQLLLAGVVRSPQHQCSGEHDRGAPPREPGSGSPSLLPPSWTLPSRSSPARGLGAMGRGHVGGGSGSRHRGTRGHEGTGTGEAVPGSPSKAEEAAGHMYCPFAGDVAACCLLSGCMKTALESEYANGVMLLMLLMLLMMMGE